jgi:hypothetical protein
VAGYTSNQPGVPTILGVNTAVSFSKGVPGSSGVANDTILNGLKIQLNGTAVTVTLTGFRDHTGAAANIVFTGSTTVDTWIPLGWINSVAGLTVTASVASKVVVETLASGFVP